MRIGILGGTGPAGTALGARLASVGYDVTLGSRSKYRAMEVVDGLLSQWPDYDLNITAQDNEGAAGADLVVLATPWDSAATTAHALEKQLNGKVVVSMANALVKVGHEFQPLVPPRGSVAASVQAAVPGCHVAAAFHHLPARSSVISACPLRATSSSVPTTPRRSSPWPRSLAASPGVGRSTREKLSNATAIEAFTAVLLQLNVRYKTRVAPRLTGIKIS